MQPTLVVMAAGIGSRFGGLKQIEPFGPSGEIFMLIIQYMMQFALDLAKWSSSSGMILKKILRKLSDLILPIK